MTTAVATSDENRAIAHAAMSAGEIMENVIIKGDLSKLSPTERSQYYLKVCESVGLNPLTKPFEYITLNGKLTLYALRACTDQLRGIHEVSVDDLSESERDGVYIVTAKVRNSKGRTDMAKGAVPIANLKGDALANAMMKAETKAKRRATLSLCGLGFLDETEIETIPAAARGSASPSAIAPVARTFLPAADPETGEVGPRAIPVPMDGDHPQWTMWAQTYIAAHEGAASLAESDGWIAANIDTVRQIEALPKSAKFVARLNAAVAKERDRFSARDGMDIPADSRTKPIETVTGDPRMLEPSDLNDPANILSGG